MKWILRILLILLAILIPLFVFLYLKADSSAPRYKGNIELKGLTGEVNVFYDEYGIPHIEAQNKADLYRAFGYVHAQDRLFQMELLRRAGSGRLSEIIGEKMIGVDRIFHTIGLPGYARESAMLFENLKGQPIHDDVTAYLDGINQFIASGNTPPECSIIGFEPQPFTIEDMFCITGAMSFSFSQAQKTEPVISYIQEKYDSTYLGDIGLWHGKNETFIPNRNRYPQSNPEVLSALGNEFDRVLSALPFSPLEGSNAWVVSGSKTSSGKVIFCNDTHIGYLIPQTWYEAYLHSPEFELYGHFMAAVPFALVGRNSELSWGLTMLLNDDMDFFYERTEGDSVFYQGKKVALHYRDAEIKVKGQENVQLHIPVTPHGPIVNNTFEGMTEKGPPIAIQWTYTSLPNHTVEAFYAMNNATQLSNFEAALPMIHAPGLSVNYGDARGNVAWWACARLVNRPENTNSWTILDGSTGHNDWEGYHDFRLNPRQLNPESGFIYSANDWPGAMLVPRDSLSSRMDTLWYPGYYKPQNRGDRITKVLSEKGSWNMENMQSLMTDTKSHADAMLMLKFKHILNDAVNFNRDEPYAGYAELWPWDGQYQKEDYKPTFFNKMLYHYLHMAMADELGEDMFRLFLTTHQVQRTQNILIESETSAWWDNVNTPDKKETREDIIKAAFLQSIHELQQQFGNNPKIWNWRKACQLELKHPLGEVALLRPIFNVGPMPVDGGNETVMQSGFVLNGKGEYMVHFGSQMRIIVDFAHPDSALNVTPCGQSGHLMSKHYSDQSDLYVEKKFRIQRMSTKRSGKEDHLRLIPPKSS